MPIPASENPASENETAVSKISLKEALQAARETRELVVAPGALSQVARVFAEQFPGCAAVVVGDVNTMRVAGDAVRAALASAGVPLLDSFVYNDAGLYAETAYVVRLEESLKTHQAIPVAVGSGTINDLVKLASHRTGRRYLCVSTAASMDGYTAFGASITHEGAKQTFNCPAPQAVIADIDIIKQAPPDMTASGYADLLAKVTAGADWIIAGVLGEEAIDPRAWNLVQGGLREALARPAEARSGEPVAISQLTEGLMLGGFAMQWARSSRPASGAEHQFSHLWDMEHHTHNGAAPSHGFKVGVATRTVTLFYEQLMLLDVAGLDVERLCAAWPSRDAVLEKVKAEFASGDFAGTAVRETGAKYVDAGQLRKQLTLLKEKWPEIVHRLSVQLIPGDEIKRRLVAVGAPVEPEQIGISRARLRDSFHKAYHIRRRFTVLDLATRAGCFDACLGGLFGPGGVWEIK
ncbi:MAG: sn-glycerol-1-phosphate dehydrogenase [Opitutaceae bacterium]|jgi:glycerol-1-phosphate dehydrogenase [NAD(P)+]|nr:sn-glycerol-1-phosphate dehydrogenase [Opitutaceae bacterium]